MGVLFSCPADDYDPLDMEEAPPAGTSGGGAVLKALGSGKLHIEGSLSFKRAQAASGALHVETEISIRAGDAAAPAPEPAGPLPREVARARFTEPAVESPKHEAAALRLQKVYKSFRTRRQLADCAVLVEQSWWKLLDFALLKRSSVSFFDIEKQETAMSKWSRARTRAAKVGKGLLKDDKAQKLALQHWLEAIDPRHRYGHNLHYYYDCWLQCESKQPFFYWLDIGEGREINLEGKCPRSKLLSQCIKYLGPKEREDYEVVIEDGKFLYKKSGRILDTSCGPRDAKWIFVLSTSKILYVGQKRKGVFQHSSFLAGGATSAAGRLVVENGTLKAIWPHSGHYRPTEENFQEFQSFLKDNMVDLTEVKFWGSLRRVTSESEKTRDQTAAPEETGPCQTLPEAVNNGSTEIEKCEEETAMARPDSSEDDQEAAEEQAPVPREKILERINSKKEMKSYQLGKQLSFKWTTGAGPRIGCVRDYPSELQVQALEQVNLSPRCGSTAAASRFASPLRRSFNQPAAAAPRGCDASTPRGASRSPLQHGTPAVEAAAD
uniref:Calmodulin-binding family protein n=1 Tax=Setaria italica TaxID=4555 RepID=K4A817_SETIT